MGLQNMNGSRRRLFGLLFLPIRGINAKPRLGDADWMRAFRTFIKACNAFVMALDDGKLDSARWEEMRAAWRALDPPPGQ